MSYTYNTSAANSASGNTVTISPTAGALLIVFSATSGGAGTPTVTFSDNSSSTWANASNNVVVNGLHYSVGYCLSANSGVTTITATYNGGTPGTCDIVAISYTGMTSPSFVGVTTPLETVSPGAGTISTNALACGSTNALFVGFVRDELNSPAYTAGAGFTMRYNNAPNTFGLGVEDPAAEVTGSNTATWTVATHGTDTFAAVAVAFADNGGGAAQIIMGQACL